MTDEIIPADKFIESPTTAEEKAALIPSDDETSLIIDEDTKKIVFILKTPSTASGDVTGFDVISQNVKSIDVEVEIEDGTWKEPPLKFSPDKMPVELEAPLKDVIRLIFTLTRDQKSTPMSVEIGVKACLKKLGKNLNDLLYFTAINIHWKVDII